MNFLFNHCRSILALAAAIVYTLAIAANVLSLSSSSNVTQSVTPIANASMVRLAYQDGNQLRKSWLVAYTEQDRASQRNHVVVKYSLDEGTSWSAPVLLSIDAAGIATEGQQPKLIALSGTGSPKLMVAWTSPYCPANTPPPNTQTLECVWVATSNDPQLQQWSSVQLSTGQRHASQIVAATNSSDGGLGIAWVEEAPGAGSNIWYTHSTQWDLASLRHNLAQASNNNATTAPGASQPHMAIQNGSAVLVYQESYCNAATPTPCIVMQNFPYAQPGFSKAPGAEGEAGSVISTSLQYASQPHVTLQASSSASQLRTLVTWHESASNANNAPTDIVLRRGIRGASAPGSSGYLSADLLQDTPQKLTHLAASGIHSKNPRALINDNQITLALQQNSANNTSAYNVYLMQSQNAGGLWSNPKNISKLNAPGESVSTHQLVGTPGSISNPVTGSAGLGDTQDPRIVFMAYAVQNKAAAQSQPLFVSRSKDFGATFEPFLMVAGNTAASTQVSLTPSPDGASANIMWQNNTNAMFATALPPLSTATDPTQVACGCGSTSRPQKWDPLLPAMTLLSAIALGLNRQKLPRHKHPGLARR